MPSFLLLSSLLVSPSFAIDFGDFGDFAQNQNCKAFSCDKGYAPVPKKKAGYSSAGCNAMGGGGLSMFGGGDDEANEQAYEICCHQFHACYQVCGSIKQSCDANYDKCVQAKCATTKDAKACVDQANMHTMMLKLAGCKNHEAEQGKHCTCVTKYGDKHLEAREESLRQFYKKHAPESVGKAKELMKKAETVPKFAKLMIKLIQKYPSAIEIVEDPQAKMYRNMFGKSGDYADDADDEGGSYPKDPDDFDLDDEEEEEESEDFEVNEDLGGYGEDEDDEEAEEDPDELLKQAEEMRKKAEKLKAEREKAKKEKARKERKKRDPPPRQPKKVEEPEEIYDDEFNQYEEL